MVPKSIERASGASAIPVPLRAAAEVDAGEGPARPDGGAHQHGGVALGVGPVERGRPGAADRHRLVLAAHAHQELDHARRVHQRLAAVRACKGKDVGNLAGISKLIDQPKSRQKR